MASAPPVPPRPYSPTSSRPNPHPQHQQYPGPPPPLPPLPADLRTQTQRYNTPSPYEYAESPPHFENPMIAPRPHRLNPSIPANMAQRLDDQVYQHQQFQTQPQLQSQPQFQSQPQLPPQLQSPSQPQTQSPWATQWSTAPAPSLADVTQSIANLNINLAMPPPPAQLQPQSAPAGPIPAPAPGVVAASGTGAAGLPSLTAPLPNLTQLDQACTAIQSPTHDPALKIAWCRDILFLVERARDPPGPQSDPPVGAIAIADPVLKRLSGVAVQMVLGMASQGGAQGQGGGKLAPHVAEAIYHRAMLTATGAFPQLIGHNPRTAFRDFEAAARGGYPAAWFRLGRDYENFNDHAHAKECFERGVRYGVESCIYRMGMAHLLGQLSLPPNPTLALPLLHRSATLASLNCPQPAYVFSLLLSSSFTSLPTPLLPTAFAPFIPAGSSPTLEARKHLERAAYLHFGAAQYKIGHAYEFAEPPWGFDPVLSVMYYELASRAGEAEADMALSKWFLCGSTGAATGGDPSSTTGGFEKDEGLALVFAEKAARKGLASAEFAMGYYAEVGVGQGRDLEGAVRWYKKAAAQGNTDAADRLTALSSPSATALSRQEHDTITEAKLTRRRTQAALKSQTQPLSPPWEGKTFPSMQQLSTEGRTATQGAGQNRRNDGRLVVDVIRKNSMAAGYVPPAQPPFPQPHSAAPSQGGGGGQGRRYDWSDPQTPVSASSLVQPPRRSESPGRLPGVPGGKPVTGAGIGANPIPAPHAAHAGVTGGGGGTPGGAGGGKKPQTFAEMGFHGAKADEKECVIM
ncbi:hypothetical protein BJ165DRAFT_1378429 [Panaeolus papilionaceus]|nr:hypothetical protein BJ165DRAFT_1378429 [Panaeolus papilionaceus]